MPSVKINMHGIQVELEDGYGELDDLSGRALGLVEQVTKVFHAQYANNQDTQAPISTDN